MMSMLDHSFPHATSIDADLRKTFAGLWREQRQQVPAQVDGDDTEEMFPARQRKHAAVSGGAKIDLLMGPQFR